MKLEFAKDIARDILKELWPYCSIIKVAGSVRRKKPEPNDLEFVLVRKQAAIVGFYEVMKRWQKVKGDPLASYTRRRIDGIKVDFFMVDADNFGMHHAIRTGSAKYSHALAKRWSELGYESIKGYLHEVDRVTRDCEEIRHAFKTEQDLFDFLGVDMLPPEQRIDRLVLT